MRAKKMRGLSAITMLLVMGSICFAAIEPEVSVVVFEPNDPNWSPSDCFTPAWERVTLSTRLSNPEEVSGADGYNSSQSLSMYFNFYKADTRNLISHNDFYLNITEATIVDDQNNVYTYESFYPWLDIYSPVSYSYDQDEPAFGYINFPMDPNKGYPARLSQVNLSFDGLFAYAIKTVKVPLQVSDQWIDILPNFSIQIEKAEIEERMLSYSIKGKYIGSDEPFDRSGTLRIDEPIPQCIDLGISFLDENGNTISTYGSSSLSIRVGNFITDYTFSGSYSCDDCDCITTIQFKYAIDSYVDTMLYTLKDIPVPTF